MVCEIMKDIAFLSQKAEEATARDISVGIDLLDTLEAHKDGCVGMAANMIGVNKRIIVFDDDGKYTLMFNPVIIKKSSPYQAEEGCLSVPGKWGVTARPARVTARYTDRDGKERELRGEGLLARAICHELDHLDGKLFTDVTLRYVESEG